jgi:hypothetical protein
MSEKLIIRTHDGAGAYNFRKDMHNIAQACRIEERPDSGETEYRIFLG